MFTGDFERRIEVPLRTYFTVEGREELSHGKAVGLCRQSGAGQYSASFKPGSTRGSIF